jgi:ComF family protein
MINGNRIKEVDASSFLSKKPLLFFKRVARRWMTPFRDVLFPSRCLICGILYDAGTNGDDTDFIDWMTEEDLFKASFEQVMNRLLSRCTCPECVTGFVPILSPLCPVCGVMFIGRQGTDHLCPKCDAELRAFGKARAVGVYEQGMMTAVHRLKYEGKIQLAHPFGMLMFILFYRIWNEDPVDVVIPVPLHRRRLKSRGFNQAYLLVKNWPRYSLIYGKPEFAYRISGDILIRTRWERPQTGLNRKERRAGIQGAFAVKKPSLVAGKRILLVDDVHTTGATAEACATALTEAGAFKVDVLTLARTL